MDKPIIKNNTICINSSNLPLIKILKTWLQTELLFQENDYHGKTESPFCSIENKNSNVGLVSVHGIYHFTNNSKPKVPDIFTGSLVSIIGDLYNLTTIINKKTDNQINPHEGKCIAFDLIDTMSNQPSCWLDIHGMKNNPLFDVAIGTSRQPPTHEQEQVIAVLVGVLESLNLKYVINNPSYSAKSPYSITSHLLHIGHNCPIQVELSYRLRNPNDPFSENTIKMFHLFLENFK